MIAVIIGLSLWPEIVPPGEGTERGTSAVLGQTGIPIGFYRLGRETKLCKTGVARPVPAV
jgi:hypothetical protein